MPAGKKKKKKKKLYTWKTAEWVTEDRRGYVVPVEAHFGVNPPVPVRKVK
jgi:hypothetical protein